MLTQRGDWKGRPSPIFFYTLLATLLPLQEPTKPWDDINIPPWLCYCPWCRYSHLEWHLYCYWRRFLLDISKLRYYNEIADHSNSNSNKYRWINASPQITLQCHDEPQGWKRTSKVQESCQKSKRGTEMFVRRQKLRYEMTDSKKRECHCFVIHWLLYQISILEIGVQDAKAWFGENWGRICQELRVDDRHLNELSESLPPIVQKG